MTTNVASASSRLTNNAAKPMQGAVSRLQGSPKIDEAGSGNNILKEPVELIHGHESVANTKNLRIQVRSTKERAGSVTESFQCGRKSLCVANPDEWHFLHSYLLLYFDFTTSRAAFNVARNGQ